MTSPASRRTSGPRPDIEARGRHNRSNLLWLRWRSLGVVGVSIRRCPGICPSEHFVLQTNNFIYILYYYFIICK